MFEPEPELHDVAAREQVGEETVQGSRLFGVQGSFAWRRLHRLVFGVAAKRQGVHQKRLTPGGDLEQRHRRAAPRNPPASIPTTFSKTSLLAEIVIPKSFSRRRSAEARELAGREGLVTGTHGWAEHRRAHPFDICHTIHPVRRARGQSRKRLRLALPVPGSKALESPRRRRGVLRRDARFFFYARTERGPAEPETRHVGDGARGADAPLLLLRIERRVRGGGGRRDRRVRLARFLARFPKAAGGEEGDRLAPLDDAHRARDEVHRARPRVGLRPGDHLDDTAGLDVAERALGGVFADALDQRPAGDELKLSLRRNETGDPTGRRRGRGGGRRRLVAAALAGGEEPPRVGALRFVEGVRRLHGRFRERTQRREDQEPRDAPHANNLRERAHDSRFGDGPRLGGAPRGGVPLVLAARFSPRFAFVVRGNDLRERSPRSRFLTSNSSPSVSLSNSSTDSTRTSASASPPPPKTAPAPTSVGTDASTNVRSFSLCPNGGTVPGTNPHASMVSSRVARRTRLFATPILAASFLTSTFVSPLVTTTTNAPSTANTKLLTIDSTSTPSASALDATSGVSAPSHRTSVAAPSRAASQEARSFDVRIAGPAGPDAPVDSTSVAETRPSRATDAVATRPLASGDGRGFQSTRDLD